MKHAGVKSKIAENACLWTVTILDDNYFKLFDFNLHESGYHVCKFDDSILNFSCVLFKNISKLWKRNIR